MHEKTLIAQRTVYNAIAIAGGPSNVPIEKEMMISCMHFSARYRAALDDSNKENEKTRTVNTRKRIYKEIKTLEATKQLLEDEVKIQNIEISNAIENLQKQIWLIQVQYL